MPFLKLDLATEDCDRRQLLPWSGPVASLTIAACATVLTGVGLKATGVQALPTHHARTAIVAQAEEPELREGLIAQAESEVPDAQQFRALEQGDSSLSLLRAEDLLKQAQSATAAQDYDKAIELLQEAFDAFNLRSNYYQALSKSFAGIDNRLSDKLRDSARAAAQSRDETSFELAVVYRRAELPEEAVSQLVQVISSQNPTSDLGKRAYNQLYELGFVEDPYES